MENGDTGIVLEAGQTAQAGVCYLPWRSSSAPFCGRKAQVAFHRPVAYNLGLSPIGVEPDELAEDLAHA
jgi:hypothetical protein